MRNDAGTGQSASNDVGCSFACDCGRACTTYNETDPDASDYNSNDAECQNTDENNESNCQTCTTTNTTCPDDTDCIIVDSNTDGTCVDSGICTADKKTLCDDAYASVSGSTNKRAKCCPATSGCIRTQIGVKATSSCSTNCGSCLGGETAPGGGNVKNQHPETFCKFGQRLGEIYLMLSFDLLTLLAFQFSHHHFRSCTYLYNFILINTLNEYNTLCTTT